jgi:hypothetical protein
MDARRPSTIEQTLRWYLGRDDVREDAARVNAGGPLALVGGPWDDLEGFADRLSPERPVLDITQRAPSAREVRRLYGSHPETIVLARSGERVFSALGVIAQPWYMLVSPLAARPSEALRLLREAIAQLGVHRPLDALGLEAITNLSLYSWPRGLYELRGASRRFGALLSYGNASAAARSLAVSRQAVAKFVQRRTG